MEISSIGNSQALAQMRQQMFAKADANGDGGLDIGEFEELGRNAPAGARKPDGAPDAREAFAQFDADGDGQLTEAELDAGMQAMMEAMANKVRVTDDGTQSLLDILAQAQEDRAAKADEDDEDGGAGNALAGLADTIAKYATAGGGNGAVSDLSV